MRHLCDAGLNSLLIRAMSKRLITVTLMQIVVYSVYL